MKTLAKMLVAAIVAAGMAVVLVAHGVSGNMVVMTDFCLALVLCALMGVFDEAKRKESKHDSIRHRDGRRNYGQAAAVFIGTSCLFTGSVQECEELADDLQHYAQQVEARTLTGDETFEVL